MTPSKRIYLNKTNVWIFISGNFISNRIKKYVYPSLGWNKMNLSSFGQIFHDMVLLAIVVVVVVVILFSSFFFIIFNVYMVYVGIKDVKGGIKFHFIC